MDKVSRELFLFNGFRFFYFALISFIELFIDSNTLFIALIGKFFGNNGDRYEGEWKDDKAHGQGNKSALLNYLLILTHCSLL
jgi:hypothetical protein